MEDGLDIVAVGVEKEGRIIAGMVGALARRAVVPAACRQARLVKGVDGRPVLRLEGEVMTAGKLAKRFGAVGRGNEQLVGPEMGFRAAADRDLEHLEQGLVEASARGQI